jgi:hypothetical protein
MSANRLITLCQAIAAIGCFLLITVEAAGQYVDTNTSCILCHQTTPLASDFCSTAPAAVWTNDDKHRRAFFLLHETDPADPQKGAAKRELVRRILGFELSEVFVDGRFLRLKDGADAETASRVATAKSCLRCHATWPTEADDKHSRTPPVSLDLGVSCQACHGPGEKWDQPHRLTAWRAVTPAGKAALGFADCRSSIAKAKLCASCHVGDLSQDRFVKHEWYAAGHPPLPSFELASFEAQMPAHWKSLREKGAFTLRDALPRDDGGLLAGQFDSLQRAGVPAEAIKASYREANFLEAAALGLDPCSDLARAKDAIVAGAAVSQCYARLVGDYSAAAVEKKAAWPELALYDCTACHHELRSGLSVNSRPKRNHPPGRPPLAIWPAALAPLAAQQAAGYDANQAQDRWLAVSDVWRQLERATTERPFGDPAAMQAAAKKLTEAAGQLAIDAAQTRYDHSSLSAALQFLTDPAHDTANDFSTARQAAWAIRGIASDADLSDAELLFMRGPDDPLALTLPSGPNRSVMENLNRWLPAAATYDAAWFREELRAARERMSGR